jgi:hypothetical protein
MHHIGEHGPKSLPFAPLNFIQTDVPGPAFRARPIPLREKGLFGAAGFAPAHTVPHGGMTGRHRLTIDADLLAQPPRNAGLGIGKLDPLGANPAGPTNDPSLAVTSVT